MKREAKFQVKFNHYLKHVLKTTGAFELKQTQSESLLFSAIEPHQEAALHNTKHGTFVFKIPDVGYQNPYDCFSLTYGEAFLVVLFGQTGYFYGIDIDDFIHERESSSRKSLTEERAKAIATFTSSL